MGSEDGQIEVLSRDLGLCCREVCCCEVVGWGDL